TCLVYCTSDNSRLNNPVICRGVLLQLYPLARTSTILSLKFK
ncbi:hypothetical protein CDAR_537721, partial [Caerostris darwini]